MKLTTFRELFTFLLSDIYEVEELVVQELPNLIKKADSDKLRQGLQQHLADAKNQIKRLDQIFKLINQERMKTSWSSDVKNLFNDAEQFLSQNPASPLLDAAIIIFAQRIKHFEIATYGTLKSFAKTLEEHKEVEHLLKETLKEESSADALLTKIAEGGVFTAGVNVEATQKL